MVKPAQRSSDSIGASKPALRRIAACPMLFVIVMTLGVWCSPTVPTEAQQKTPVKSKPVPKTTTVIAEGAGKSRDAALKDAFRNAVRRIVGMVVDSETLVKNDEIISDKILTASRGFVARYDELSSKQEEGLWRVKILAEVERSSVVAQLKEAKINIRPLQGKDLAAAAITRAEARENATALLKKELADLPKLLLAQTRKMTPEDFDEETSTLTIDVAVRTDLKRYAAFLQRFCPFVEKINVAQDSALLAGKPELKKGEWPFLSAPAEFLAGPPLPKAKKGWCLWLLTDIDQEFLRSRWSVYLLDANLVECLSALTGDVNIRVTLLDKTGGLVAEDEFSVNGPQEQKRKDREGVQVGRKARLTVRNFGASWLGQMVPRSKNPESLQHYSHEPRSIFESPNFKLDVNLVDKLTINVVLAPMAFSVATPDIGGNLLYTPQTLYRRKIKLSLNDLKRVTEIRCSAVFRAASAETENE